MNRKLTMLAALWVVCASEAGAQSSLLANGDFAKAEGRTPAAWQIRGQQGVTVDTNAAPPGAARSLRVDITAAAGEGLGEILQVVALKPKTRYTFSGQVQGTAPGIATLQVKRLQNGKELDRIGTGWNKEGWTAVSATFDSGDADHAQLLCRFRQRPSDVGKRAWFAALALVEGGALVQAGPETGPTAIPTFNCVGLYWKPSDGAPDRTCTARYRIAGAADWRAALPLWFDSNAHEGLEAHSLEYRGSIVNLQPGTDYEVELRLDKPDLTRTLHVTTWSESFKIARQVELPVAQPGEPYVIRTGGDEQSGYVLYTPPQGQQAVWDASGKLPAQLRIEAPYVIVRGLTLRNAQINGIELGDVQHVVIEDCDISGWGRVRASDGFGADLDAAIYSASDQLEQIVVQHCHLHHPRSNSNSWKQQRVGGTFHPGGPQGIVFRGGKGRYVIRYNRIDSDLQHMYNDSMGEVRNFSFAGFPNRDSDVYGNYVSHCWDDGIEIEGANMNVRIWGNYITMTLGALGCASTSLGPSYYFRNVYAVSRKSGETDVNAFRGHYLIKMGAEAKDARFAAGRKYFLHNTALQPPTVGGPDPTSGAQEGMILTSATKRELNIVSRNNILFMRRDTDQAIRDPQLSPSNDFDYDLYFGKVQAVAGAEAHGIQAQPQFEAAPDGRLWLRPGSPGHDAAVPLANFNDDFVGKGPDMGAVETGTTEPKPATWPAFPPAGKPGFQESVPLPTGAEKTK